MKKIYTSLLVLSMVVLMSTGAFSQKILMFVANGASYEATGSQSEIDLFDTLVAWGFDPVWYPTSTGFTEGGYGDYDGIFISEAVGSGSVNDIAVQGYQLPIVTMEGWSPHDDRWGWVASADEYIVNNYTPTDDDRFTIIQDNTHYITSVFDQDQEIPYTTGNGITESNFANNSFKPNAAVQPITNVLGINKGQVANGGFVNMVAIDENDAPNKIFLWGIVAAALDEGILDVRAETEEFWTVIKRACQWAYDEMDNTAVRDVKNKPSFELTAFPNPAQDRVIVRFESPVQGDGVATLYSITGQRMDAFTMNVIPGKNYLELSAGDYAPGVYHLSLELEGRMEYLKIVMQ